MTWTISSLLAGSPIQRKIPGSAGPQRLAERAQSRRCRDRAVDLAQFQLRQDGERSDGRRLEPQRHLQARGVVVEPEGGVVEAGDGGDEAQAQAVAGRGAAAVETHEAVEHAL